LTAADDPLVPAEVVRSLEPGPGVRTHVASGGGHLGYVAQSPRGDNPDPDRRWIDWRVVDWLTAPPERPAAVGSFKEPREDPSAAADARRLLATPR
ncbi:MAG: hypothetical protein AAF907_18290, partial [Planctomycetota bacterium]